MLDKLPPPNLPPGSTFPPRLRARIKPHVYRATTPSYVYRQGEEKKSPLRFRRPSPSKISYWNKESLAQLFPLFHFPPGPLTENACKRNQPRQPDAFISSYTTPDPRAPREETKRPFLSLHQISSIFSEKSRRLSDSRYTIPELWKIMAIIWVIAAPPPKRWL